MKAIFERGEAHGETIVEKGFMHSLPANARFQCPLNIIKDLVQAGCLRSIGGAGGESTEGFLQVGSAHCLSPVYELSVVCHESACNV